MPEDLVLRCGSARWLRRAHGAAGFIACMALLTCGAGPVWTACAVAALVATQRFIGRHMRHTERHGRLHLARDGGALLFTAGGLCAARRLPGGWVTRALCVVPLRDRRTGKRFHCVLCRSLNGPDTWRRLLAALRLPDSTAEGPVLA